MNNLCSSIRTVLKEIKTDFGGGCSLEKACLLAWLIKLYDLKTTLDIGVYRGRSLFPQAFAHAEFTKGVVYGVDPWEAEEAREHDVHPEIECKIAQFVDRTNFEEIFQQVLFLCRQFGYEEYCRILRKTSAEASIIFEENGVFFDLIHIDGNHDTDIVMKDIELYLPRLNPRGFIVLDDISWDSVKPAYQLVATKLKLVYRSTSLPRNDYAIFWDTDSHITTILLQFALWYIDRVNVMRFTRT